MSTPLERQLEASADFMRNQATARAWKRMSAAVCARARLMTNEAPFEKIRRANERVTRAIRAYVALTNPPTDKQENSHE